MYNQYAHIEYLPLQPHDRFVDGLGRQFTVDYVAPASGDYGSFLIFHEEGKPDRTDIWQPYEEMVKLLNNNNIRRI
ncbi:MULTISPECIES: hypothetical protein [Olivibacter]|jgi:hypothetical protein|uniref:Uncharacterized protein n=1 Tax=Olivibacter jilunii TaxID=985016 RepID=A0ABW6B0F9_9SPHI